MLLRANTCQWFFLGARWALGITVRIKWVSKHKGTYWKKKKTIIYLDISGNYHWRKNPSQKEYRQKVKTVWCHPGGNCGAEKDLWTEWTSELKSRVYHFLVWRHECLQPHSLFHLWPEESRSNLSGLGETDTWHKTYLKKGPFPLAPGERKEESMFAPMASVL